MTGASNYPYSASGEEPWIRGKLAYFHLLVILILTIAIASFVRVRGQGLSNISLWIFAFPFVLTLVGTRVGLLSSAFLLTVTPALHLQINAVAGTHLVAWAYPGVDACLGFLSGWVCKGNLTSVRSVLARFPAGPLLLFHAWISLSALVAVTRNVWQSASEPSIRGLAYNVWLVRGISWLDDYYPLQDAFFCSVALVMLFGVWSLLERGGDRLLRSLLIAVLAGAVINAVFGILQRLMGLAWISDTQKIGVNSLWPDLHSFGAFMAMALFLGYGLLKVQPRLLVNKVVIGLALSAVAAGLYVSTSRSTLVIVCVGLLSWGIWSAFRLRGWRRAIPVMAVAALISAIDWTLSRGYRGYTYDSLRALIDGFSTGNWNRALSHRPEIWNAAIDMYRSFPLFGLGQGSFYRLSSLPEFSGSDVLVSLGGSSAHNYFLQTFVELGPVSLIVALLIAIPVLRLGKQNFGLVSFYALLGIAVGNVYAHSLLVRETLMLCAVFLGVYFWESQTIAAGNWRALEPRTIRFSLWGVAALGLIGLVEVSRSFGRTPFSYGERCFVQRPVAQDGWTSGLLRQPIPASAARIDFELSADRPDLERRPLTVGLSVSNEGGATLWSRSLELSRPLREPQRFMIDLPEPPSATRFLVIKASHCFVPLNLGLTYDPRRLGVRVTELRFHTKADTDTSSH